MHLNPPPARSAPSSIRARVACALALFGLALGACSDDEGGPGTTCAGGDFTKCDIPQIDLLPNARTIEIVDAGMAPGETQNRTIRVINVGEAALSLRNVRLDYEAPSGGDDRGTRAFQLGALPELPIGIQVFGGDTFPQGVDITITFTKPNDTLPREAKLVLKSNDPLQSNGELVVTFTTAVGLPALTAQPNPVDFGLVPRDRLEEGQLTLLNTGTRDLTVTGFKITADGRFGFKGDGFEAEGADAVAGLDLDTPIVVPEGEGRPITVTFRSDSPLPAESELLVFSDDPNSGVNGYSVKLVANKSGPCITVNPKRIVFGGKVVGTVSKIDFEVTSCGTEPLVLSSVTMAELSSPDFTFDFSRLPAGWDVNGPTAANPLSVPVNDKVTIGVFFVPDAVNPRDAENIPIPDEGTIVVGSNGFDSTVEIPVEGAGADVACPTPVIVVKEGEEVIPQTVIHLSADESYAPFGAIVQTLWSVTSPEGAPTPIFIPASDAAEPVVELNTVGLYTFKLKVRDEFGTSSGAGSCPDATYQVLVQPDQAIHVELTWVTPGDVDETDTGEGMGSDLDLHFAHQDARGPDLDGDTVPDPWFADTWDTFWFNKNPDWATLGEERDNPSLDRDDYDGAGPENLNLSVPQDDVSYRIGVHYWNDWGWGASDATVKVFHYADLIYEVTFDELHELDMWCVGDIHWPVPAVDRCAADGDPEQITPRYVNPFYQPPL